MPPRLLSPLSLCLFVIFISAMVLAQSNPVPLINQSTSVASPVAASAPDPKAQAKFLDSYGKLPLSFESRAPKATRLSQDSGLNFAPAVTYNSGGQDATSVVLADLNGDGKLDLVILNQCADSSCNNGSVGVLLGNGDGTFQTVATYGSGGKGAFSVTVADVNLDGKPDLLVANRCVGCANGSVGVLLGNGDGTFQTVVTYGSGGEVAFSVAIADVNLDGKPDLLVGNQCADGNCDNGSVGVLLGNGDGTFQTAVPYLGPAYASALVVADFNGDGKPDLALGGGAAHTVGAFIGVLLGNGDGTFQTALVYASDGDSVNSMVVADVNGEPDVVAAVGNSMTLLLGNGDGTFQDVSTGAGTSGARLVVVADVNGDGKLDLVVLGTKIAIRLGNGDGTFQKAVAYSLGAVTGLGLVVADVNGDGNPDIVVAGCSGTNCGNGGVGVLLGNGDGTFQPLVSFGSGGQSPKSVIVADVNGDGKPDIVVANECADSSCNNGSVGVLINSSLTATATALTSSQNPSSFGQAVTFTATVTAQKGFYKGTPTGKVSFLNGKTNIGNSNLNSSGVATLKTSTLPVGTDSITATYNGDANFAPSTSRVLQQVVHGAVVSLSPTSLNFGNQTVGITSQPQVTTLTNTGNINLTISSIQITGANSGDFAEKNTCGKSVAPGGTCKITVTFTPLDAGKRTAAVSIKDNAPGSPQTVPLSGTGVLPSVTFSPTSLTFPTQLVFTAAKPNP